MRSSLCALLASMTLAFVGAACGGSGSSGSASTGEWGDACVTDNGCLEGLGCFGNVCSQGGVGEETGGGRLCAPGSKLICNCPDGSTSKAECAPDGLSFFPCQCGAETGEETGFETGATEETGEETGFETGLESGEETGLETSEETGGSGEVDPQCLDGQYTETLADPDANISGDSAAYSPANVIAFIQSILLKRYPHGWTLVDGGMNSSLFGESCVDTFLGDTSSAAAVIDQMGTIVHECGHFADLDLGGFSGSGYIINADTTFICSGGGTTDNGGETFARSLIKGDAYAALHPPCQSFGDNNCADSYAGIYLDGDPTDGTFDSGDQGFDMLFEETVQYVNSLVTSYAFADQQPFTTSARDGILTFLWYLERYLQMARFEYPDAYTLLKNDTCWREAILTVWGRAWLYLDITENMNALGINDVKLMGLVLEPDLLQEIQLLRDAQGCP